MSLPGWAVGLVAVVALSGVAVTVPYLATGFEYRHRDNGLAYILFVISVGIWNGAWVAQLLSEQGAVDVFFYGLSLVGALLAGLGWFLFASTASSTRDLPAASTVYAVVALLVGIDIALSVTTPIHSFFWTTGPTGDGSEFAAFTPQLGYWLHTLLLGCLFGGGGLLFSGAYRRGIARRYTAAYAIGGWGVTLAVFLSNGVTTGGFGVASISAISLTTTAWLQASRGGALGALRGYLGIGE